jgi:hypothetical protein
MKAEIALGLIAFGAFIGLGLLAIAEAWVRVQRMKWHMAREKQGVFADKDYLNGREKI